MYALPLTITLLSVIALAQCNTLRQYGRDWLIPKPDPQVESKRITAKSVFIAPSFSAENVRCGAGFQQDATGRCVKVVHVNQAAQLDFLLQRLNAMYGAPAISHSEKQPLQVNVEIPTESENETSSMETAGIYSHVIPPEGEVSIDLLSSISEHTTKDTYDVKASEVNLVPQTPVLPESLQHETDVIVVPSKELFHVDEEPIVMLPDDDDTTENSPFDFNKNFEALFERDGEYMTATADSEETASMAAVEKNESKKTGNGNESVQSTNKSDIQTGYEAAHQVNQTQLNLDIKHKVEQNDSIRNNTQHSSKVSSQPKDAVKEFPTQGISYNKIEPESEMENMLLAENFDKNNKTVSKVSEFAATQGSTSMLMSNEKSDTKTERMPSNATTEHSVSNLETQGVSTPSTPPPPTIGGLFNPEAHDTFMNQAEPIEDKDYVDSDSDYMGPDLEVENDYSKSEGDSLSVSASTETSAMLVSVNSSVESTMSEDLLDIPSGDGSPIDHDYSGDSDDISVNFNQSVSLNSTDTSQKTEIGNSFIVPINDRTNIDDISSFTEEGNRTPFETQPYVNKENMSHFASSGVTIVGEGDLNIDSYNSKNETRNSLQKPQTDLEEEQQVVTSHHSVRVVYPQPTIEVLNVNKESHGHTLGIANSNEPKSGPKEPAYSNSPPHQFHNLSPNPLQHHNSYPAPYVPSPERVPEHPQRYSGYPYPVQAQSHPYNPYHQFHPQAARPHEQSGFVRFPTGLVQEAHRSHPYAYAHRQEVTGNVVRFPQEESRTNDKYSRWGNWGPDGGDRRVEPQQRVWAPPENRRNYWHQNRPTRRRSQLSYY